MLTDNLPYIHRVPTKLLDKWTWMFWPMMFVEIPLTLIVVPIASLFPRYEVRTDSMKRRAYDKGLPRYTQFSEMREYLPKWANWFQTHDNAMDEYWYGMYDDFINNRFTQKTYDNSKLLRYYNRVRWGYRNKAYGASYTLFGAPKGNLEPDIFETGEEDSGKLWVRLEIHPYWFHYEAQIPTIDGEYRNVNIGWKANRSAPPLKDGTYNVMYANRLAWFRRKQYK